MHRHYIDRVKVFALVVALCVQMPGMLFAHDEAAAPSKPSTP